MEPKTYEEAIELVYQQQSQQNMEDPWFHMTTGMGYRNALRLWDKTSPLHVHMKKRFGLCHGDDLGMLIFNAVKARQEGKSYDIEADIRLCQEHWKRLGYDPATMEKLGDRKDSLLS